MTASALLKTDFRYQNVDYTNLLALTGYLTQDPAQVEEMYRRMVMTLVAINKDDHATSLFYDGNPGLDLVLKAGTGIRIPRSTCLAIIRTVKEVCGKDLPVTAKLTPKNESL